MAQYFALWKKIIQALSPTSWGHPVSSKPLSTDARSLVGYADFQWKKAQTAIFGWAEIEGFQFKGRAREWHHGFYSYGCSRSINDWKAFSPICSIENDSEMTISYSTCPRVNIYRDGPQPPRLQNMSTLGIGLLFDARRDPILDLLISLFGLFGQTQSQDCMGQNSCQMG